MTKYNNSKIIEKIVAEKISCVFISPHMDDAILSAGDIISYLADKTDVSVINVFTSASAGKETLFTKRFLKLCGYKNGNKLFKARKNEESEVMKKIGIKHFNLDFIDAAWRKGGRYGILSKLFGKFIPELNHLYPIHPIHINSDEIAPQDKILIESISARLKSIINKNKNAYIFCPLAIKSHIDHVIVRDVCSQNFEKVIYWSDFPYNPTGVVYKLSGVNLSDFEWEYNKDDKIKFIMGYKSQVYSLFKDKRPSLINERFYYKPDSFNRFGVKKPTVTVGIPAYNEEKNISFLLTSIIRQKRENYKLDKIVIACDGSSDNTVGVARQYSKKYKFIKVIDGKKRIGQAGRLNNLYENNDSDIFITFDGDCFLGSADTIDKLVGKFNDPDIGLVGGNYVPFKIKSIFDKSISTMHFLWNNIRNDHKNGYNIHNHLGCISALSKDFAKIAHIPRGITGNDCFIYAQAIESGFKFSFTHEAFVYVNLPGNIKDFAQQTSRFVNNSREMTNHFGEWIIEDVHISRRIKIKAIIEMFFKEPVYLPLALFFRILVIIYKPFINANKYKNILWEPIKSSKTIYE